MSSTLAVGMLIHQNSSWLGSGPDGLSDLVKPADDALSAHEDGRYRESILYAASCLEGLLKRMLKARDLKIPPMPSLGNLITAAKSEDTPVELIQRLRGANAIRNRAAHDNPHRLSQITEGDSLAMLNSLQLIVEWYRDRFHAEHEAAAQPDSLRVFLSVGSPHRLDQQQFLNRLRAEIRGLGVELCTLSTSEFSKDKPFDQISALMLSCCAALVVGFDRSHAYAVFERERSDGEQLYQDQYVPTAWNQIEGSIASALRLPLLVLRDIRLHQEGIFEASNHRHTVRDFDLAEESRELTAELRKFLAGWIDHVRSIEPPN